MKSKEIDDTDDVLKMQVVNNSINLQAILEILVDLDVIDTEKFNELVNTKYKELQESIDNAELGIEDEPTTYYGSVGEA